MPQQMDFILGLRDDGTLTVVLQDQTSVSGWGITFQMWQRFGSTDPIATKSCASGFNNVSGINVTNGAQGQFNVNLYASELSGYNPSNFAYRVWRDMSGQQMGIVEGFRVANY